MNEPTERLEHLISRCLDGQATGAERRELRTAMRRDPAAAELYDELRQLDRLIGATLRREARRPRRRPVWLRLVQSASLAAAACVAAIVWPHIGPAQRPQTPGSVAPQLASFFAPPPSAAAGDSFSPEASREREPHGAARSEREWIVVPGDRPGEYLVVEVRRPAPQRPGGGQDF